MQKKFQMRKLLKIEGVFTIHYLVNDSKFVLDLVIYIPLLILFLFMFAKNLEWRITLDL